MARASRQTIFIKSSVEAFGLLRFSLTAAGRSHGFYLENETFGVEADGEYGFSAEAIVDTKFIATKRSPIEVLASEDEQIARELRALLGGELRRARDHALLLVKRAPERLATFLVDLSERIQSGDEVELPMSRRDIADHLGLTIETVSRTLAILESLSAIDLPRPGASLSATVQFCSSWVHKGWAQIAAWEWCWQKLSPFEF